MISWKDNTIMLWDTGSGEQKVSDHGRSSLDVSYQRLGTDQRMIDGLMRRHSTAKKRTWTVSWENLPARTTAGGFNTVDDGMDGETLEEFYYDNDGVFTMILRDGAGNRTNHNVLITDFSKTVVKRGNLNDLWNLSITLEEQ